VGGEIDGAASFSAVVITFEQLASATATITTPHPLQKPTIVPLSLWPNTLQRTESGDERILRWRAQQLR
jgi:hypothetical protein